VSKKKEEIGLEGDQKRKGNLKISGTRGEEKRRGPFSSYLDSTWCPL
jgi:hypothetical protein